MAFSDLWILNPLKLPVGVGWSLAEAQGPHPPARGGHSATVLGDRLYIFGGNTTQVGFNDLWFLDLPVKEETGARWQQVPTVANFPPARIGHSAMALGDRIIIYGGRDLVTGRYMWSPSCFDARSQAFAAFSTPAFAAADTTQELEGGGMWSSWKSTGHSTVLCEEGLITFGGLMPSGPTQLGGVHNVTWLLDVVGAGDHHV
ncbi:unnamed protein product [Discosporangium mesarthrocarpum]